MSTIPRKRLSRMKYLFFPKDFPRSPAYVRVSINGDELQRIIGKKNLIHKFSLKLSKADIERQAPAIIAGFLGQIERAVGTSASDYWPAKCRALVNLADETYRVERGGAILDKLEAAL